MISYNKNSKREIDYFLPWLWEFIQFIYCVIREYYIMIGCSIFSMILLFYLYKEIGLFYAYTIAFVIMILGCKAQVGNNYKGM